MESQSTSPLSSEDRRTREWLWYDPGTQTQVVQPVTEVLVPVILARHYDGLAVDLLRRSLLHHQVSPCSCACWSGECSVWLPPAEGRQR